MNRNEIKTLFPNASAAFIRANDDLGEMEADGAQCAATRPLDESRREREAGPPGLCVRVTLIAIRRRLLDSDAVAFACKPLRDAIAQTLLGGTAGQFDDDPRIEWEYHQLKTRGPEGVIVYASHQHDR